LAAAAKELGLQHQREKRKQIRRVTAKTPDNNKPIVVRRLDYRERHSPAARKKNDTFDLRRRFVENQKLYFSSALNEIRHGSKRGCWLWFIIPTAPYIVNGKERGSRMNRIYALRGDDCVKAYLKFEALGVSLRKNYLTMTRAIRQQLLNGNTLSRIFGPMDDVKVINSLLLFERIALEMKDQELADACRDVLDPTNPVLLNENSKVISPGWI